MTNLEANKDKIEFGDICLCAHIIKYGKRCNGKFCIDCEFSRNADECIKEILAEYKEPIKLKQWEFELIGYIYRTSSVKKMFFVHYSELNYLRGVGYFKGITNEYMTLKEILENCEVVDR